MDGASRFGVWGLHEAEDLACVLVYPIALVVDVVLRLLLKVLHVGFGDVAGCDASQRPRGTDTSGSPVAVGAVRTLRLLALAAGLVHNHNIADPGRHFAVYGTKTSTQARSSAAPMSRD